MCGIAGYVGSAPPGLLSRMLGALKHRGPDDDGRWEGPGVALGMTRLAIIDLVTGRQPMVSEDGRYTLVFNGEIYNYRALRRDLESAGHRFRTQSDTEVLLQTLAALGLAGVEFLRGMFAFACWDRAEERLLLGRDRLGKKPLFTARVGDALLVASEIKALRCHPDLPTEPDRVALDHYLAFGYTPGDRSLFRAVQKLPPAHVGVWQRGVLTLSRYWEPRPGPAPATFAEATAATRERLREAVRLRLESDVPVGVFLSGGIDSGSIVGLVREVSDQPVRTFTVGFEGAPDFDERELARAVATRHGTVHTELAVDPDRPELLDDVLDAFDEPFADSSAVLTLLVARATAGHVKVALAGIGGDELFGGYPRYLGIRLARVYDRLPMAARRWLTRAVPAVIPETMGSRNLGSWVRRFTAHPEAGPTFRYERWMQFFPTEQPSDLFTDDWIRAAGPPPPLIQPDRPGPEPPTDPEVFAVWWDLMRYVPNDLLAMADRLGMAASLEVRAPFCDHELVAFSLGLHPHLKTRGFRLKALLRAAVADLLPPAVLRGRKRGFMLPIGRWLQTSWRDRMEDLLSPPSVRRRGWFRPEVVETLKAEHLTGRRNRADQLWTLMVLEAWCRRVFDGPPGGAGAGFASPARGSAGVAAPGRGRP